MVNSNDVFRHAFYLMDMLIHKRTIGLLFALGIVAIIIVTPLPVFSQLNENNLETHTHTNLTMIQDGRRILVPANIGIDHRLWKDHSFDRYSVQPQKVSALHTHASDGIIHIESTVFKRFTLGDFLKVWGMDQTKIANITSDGNMIKLSNYSTLPLQDHQHLTMILRTEAPKNISHFVNRSSGLAFQYPSNWNVTNLPLFRPYQPSLGESSLFALLLFPKEAAFLGAPHLTPILKIEVYKLPPQNMTLDQYVLANLPEVLKDRVENHPNVTVNLVQIDSDLYNLGGSLARKIVLVKDISTEEIDLKQKTMQLWTIKNDKAYIVTFSGIISPSATSFTYKDYSQYVEKILSSINLG